MYLLVENEGKTEEETVHFLGMRRARVHHQPSSMSMFRRCITTTYFCTHGCLSFFLPCVVFYYFVLIPFYHATTPLVLLNNTLIGTSKLNDNQFKLKLVEEEEDITVVV